mmetsp:Transcript_77848/g.137275  ORF Transcript_77848/g.137275 Transcript_77848/m.137275 type:complete len:264 (+) Transcript_77848:70-861(+)|eukprot:CAMPEP_0197662252 /NCGR_PEP_ID=MMETSP1338-20131121/52660_1 /TAXON_ID=43686 ORGANISM="Pelagodinium beii, Strain RCC1491" /NCGR_SAMPLE_ID=MMETSP1338 /ASSEMBLY_ACC=CAM_ASM_000754 /LENGTH=263 /DNA_ID=CAMNT_0043240013 /DNA_START=58 /DNA_END=849 /DNA_ORIENTATION=-
MGKTAAGTAKRPSSLVKYTVLAPPHLGLDLKLGRRYSEEELLKKCQSNKDKIARLKIALRDATLFQKDQMPAMKKLVKKSQAMKSAKKLKKVKKKLSKAQSETRKINRRKKNSEVARPGDWKRKGHAYRLIFNGMKKRTPSGLTKKSLMRTKTGRIVSKKQHNHGRRMFKENNLAQWRDAVMSTRKENNISGFVKIKRDGPRTKAQEAELYKGSYEKWVRAKVESYQKKLKNSGSQFQIIMADPSKSGDGPQKGAKIKYPWGK